MQDTYNLAVVFDDLLGDFDAAAAELTRLHERLKSVIRRVDLAYLRPSTLICRLGFEAKFVAASHIADRLSVAQTRHFRVLDLMAPGVDGDLFEKQSTTAKWQRVPSQNLEADLASLRQILGARLDGAERRVQSRTSLVVPVRFHGGPEDGLGLAREVSTKGMYVESDVLPPRGTKLTMQLEPLIGTELNAIQVTVMHAMSHEEARRLGRVPGFGVQLELTPVQRRLFDSFLVTAVQGRPWPERSGRRYERFPIRLAATWAQDGAPKRSETVNISRGGAFVSTSDPIAPGAEMSLTLHSIDGTTAAAFAVRVSHYIGPEAAREIATDRGMGVEFLECEDEITKKLGQILGARELPAVHRVLLVDDDHFFAGLLGNTFRRSAYDVRYVPSGERALKVLTEELFRFDALILDLHLPGMSGRALLDWLRKIDACSDVVVMMVTATEMNDDQQAEILALGADYIMAKDVSPQHIVQTMDGLLAGKA